MEMNFSPTEIIVCTHQASLIRACKRVNHDAGRLSNRRVANKDDFEIHLVGMMGEFAVSKFLGIPARSDLTMFGDGAVDIEFRGSRIQVKTSTHASLNCERLVFLNTLNDFGPSDWLIACSIKSITNVVIHGFISKKKFTRDCFNKNFGYGDRVCVRESDLTDINRFEEAIASYKQ
jgi:hypothetical protein